MITMAQILNMYLDIVGQMWFLLFIRSLHAGTLFLAGTYLQVGWQFLTWPSKFRVWIYLFICGSVSDGIS